MWSLNNAEPVEALPWAFLHQGNLYTDPDQWFPVIGAAAGWADVPDKPSFDVATQNAPTWNGTAWVVASKTVEERKAYLNAERTKQFEFHRDRGVTIGGASVMTTPQAQGELKALQDDLDARVAGGEPDPTQKIATRAGDVLTVTPALATALVMGVAVHIRAIWDNDAVLQDAINNATTHSALDAIDLTAGWPA